MFKELKKWFIKKIEVDILDYIMEEVLFIKCEDRQWRLVVYLSKFLNKIEKNYEIYNKEMLAVIRNWKTRDIY